MSRLRQFFMLTITASVIFVGCNNHKIINRVDYQPLEDYQYTPATVTPGSEIELLAFSGGKRSDENNLYYYQCVGIDKSKGDTIKIPQNSVKFLLAFRIIFVGARSLQRPRANIKLHRSFQLLLQLLER